MREKALKFFASNSYSSYLNQGILISSVQTQTEGFRLAKQLLYTLVERKTALYLSGGRTPKELYAQFTRDEILLPGAVGLIDERFGERFHAESNELMLKQSGILAYFNKRQIPFYPVLQVGIRLEETAEEYDQIFRSLNATYQKSIGILGIGLDGHTAGIAGNRADFTNPMFAKAQQGMLISSFNDKEGMFKSRISMTFLGLSMLDLLLVLVFGEDKKQALSRMFTKGSEEEIPARFFKRPEIAVKTILITDQVID